MKDKLSFISSDKYKIETFKKKLKEEILEIEYLYKHSKPIFQFDNDIKSLKLLDILKDLHEDLNENVYEISNRCLTINQTLTRLILIEQFILNSLYENGINVKLENLLFFIIDSKLNLLIDTKGVIDDVNKLIQPAMSSENKELEKAGNIILNEILKYDLRHQPLDEKLNNAIIIIDNYIKALEIINSYNEHESNANVIKEELEEVTLLCENIKIIMSDNYNIQL